ncbi:MAG: bifunctional folylpolyglutamate synthase/dihydrofolate synthase [Muribaculaceae bacterium]|nr:bifunctional folylpolyglutamate synthase/dihydrofolate synthase [Muribaculaceae bacterium]
MNYKETVSYLYNCTPQFQLIGAGAYKPGLENAHILDSAFGNPHTSYPTIHVAGTNGKGSTSHTLAAVLQEAGYKVGLYTSPHLIDFRERIRVNGQKISEEGVINFVDRYRKMNVPCKPSFFELTTIMAFDWFAKQGVDVAVIETGLGGRLDTTNIITPILSIITNISFDHTAQLGNTLKLIASEKAGIIKKGTPAVIGSAANEDVRKVFIETANRLFSPIHFADQSTPWEKADILNDSNIYIDTFWGDIVGELSGECQIQNASTVLESLKILKQYFKIDAEAVKKGFRNVCQETGLMGRWMVTGRDPLIVCDTGHNVDGWNYISRRLSQVPRPLTMVIGFVNDKDVEHILALMPRDAHYIFTRAGIPRAMEADKVALKAAPFGLKGIIVPTVAEAVSKAVDKTPEGGTVFIGGSTFVVADYLTPIFDRDLNNS